MTALRSTLRSHKGLDNSGRSRVARWALGTLCLRRRLARIVEVAAAELKDPLQLTEESRLVAMLCAYAHHEESRYFAAAVAVPVEEWYSVLPSALVQSLVGLDLGSVDWGGKDAVTAMAIEHSLPDWLAQLWVTQHGAQDAALMAATINHRGTAPIQR